jgi:hypothetical protein
MKAETSAAPPWEILVARLEAYRNRLDRVLEEAGIEERVTYLEITCHRAQEPEGPPDREFRLTSGAPGQGFASDVRIVESDEEDAGGDREIALAQKLVAETLREMSIELKQDLGPYRAFPGAGIRAVISAGLRDEIAEVGGGDSHCGGWVCEYRNAPPGKTGWYWREYYPSNGQCHKRWHGRCG